MLSSVLVGSLIITACSKLSLVLIDTFKPPINPGLLFIKILFKTLIFVFKMLPEANPEQNIVEYNFNQAANSKLNIKVLQVQFTD